MLSVSFLSPVFRCGPKNRYFLGAVFWPPILARRGEAQLSGLTPVGKNWRPENGHCSGDRVWEAMFWTATPGPRAGLRLWFVFWTRFGCCLLLPRLCPSCGLRLVLKLSCASVCGPFRSGFFHMYVIACSASGYSLIYVHTCIHVFVDVLWDRVWVLSVMVLLFVLSVTVLIFVLNQLVLTFDLSPMLLILVLSLMVDCCSQIDGSDFVFWLPSL